MTRDSKGRFIKDEYELMQLSERPVYRPLGLWEVLSYAKNLFFAFMAFLFFSLVTPHLKGIVEKNIQERYCKLNETILTTPFKPK